VYVGLILVAVALIFGYERHEFDRYVSNAKPIYEYTALGLMMIWYYSKNNTISTILIGLVGIAYILQGFIYGDRSSVVILAVLYITAVGIKYSMRGMTLIAISAVALSSAVAVYRSFSDSGISQMLRSFLNRGLLLVFSDTASASFYSGIAIVAIREKIPERFEYLWKFIASIFLGSGFPGLEEANITLLAKTIYPLGGGGLYPSYFYFFGGYVGVIIGAIMLALILRIVFTGQTPYFLFLQCYMTAMSLRWFLYTPYTLFRSSIFVFSVLFYACLIFSQISKNMKCNEPKMRGVHQ